MKITILSVGKLKEKFWREAVEEYAKRLGGYCRLEIIEVADEKTPDKASPNQEEKIMRREADRILERIGASDYVCTLEISGKKLSSVEFSKWIDSLTSGGTSHITFVIGGSLGLHGSVSERADFKLSFSDMTFQIYRAFRIISGEPYHK